MPPTIDAPAPSRHSAPAARTGVLLVNLGTPAAPTTAAVRRFLREFLSDPRVVDAPRWWWLPLLHAVILPLRSPRAARNYASIWMADGSPLMVYSQRLAQGMQAALPEFDVALAMRYGEPSVAAGLATLAARGATRVVVATGIRTHWDANGRGDRLLLSFHGIPQRLVDRGDPYAAQCEASARAITARLGLADDAWRLTYQSRFGREAWLGPATIDTLRAWGAAGVRTVDVACPGFATDCLETLEEIAVVNADEFARAGGTLRYIPALNDSPAHVAALAEIVRGRLAEANA